MPNSEHVRSYYDTNSQRFANWGPGKTSRSIHREVWGEGVQSKREATWYVDSIIGDIIERELAEREALHVLDLGCGLAGTLSSLAHRFPSIPRLTGVTVSPVQVGLSREAIQKEGMASRITIHEADFHELPPLDPCDVAYAIEAFVHAQSAGVFFEQVNRVSNTDSTLVLIDDFLTGNRVAEEDKNRHDRLIKDFSVGWLAPNVITVEAAEEAARTQGFVLESETVLTPKLRLGRRRDQFIDLLYQLAGVYLIKRPYMRGLMGGAALQRAISRGWIKYSVLVFTKNTKVDHG